MKLHRTVATIRRLVPALTALAALWATTNLGAHEASTEMSAAAQNWFSSLSSEQKAKASFEFPDAERVNWHFIPRARKGLPLKEMSQEQRLLAHALLSTGLSHQGYSKSVSIMSLEAILAELEKARVNGPVRDPELYFFSLFGQPSSDKPWGFRVEGHHLSLNFTVPPKESPALTPSFFGTNPGEVRQGPRAGTRILGREEDLARSIAKSLSAEQARKAVQQGDVPKDILNDPARTDPTKPEGLPRSEMNPAQTDLLNQLVREYLNRHRPDIASEEWAKLEKDGLDKLHFLWSGGLEKGQPHYYRVQGSSFIIEYDNTQNDANHVHAVWRDLSHDFGRDVLKAHYEQAHAK